ncbi:serine hydrolase domain-containing protein [Allokutzneria oryzae]|uniref:Serine hydrolase domain-containing protein n=1 Tax=Allokutzneria oryzae TaxID=1378989 RepID=A0ABV5ZZC8_9PSEU
MGTVIAAVVVAASGMPQVAHAEVGFDPAAVDRYVEEYAENAAYPGVAVAITKGDRVVHLAGYGTVSTGAGTTSRTRMPIGSVSKSFTALAVLQLADRGALDLDAPVRRYVQDFEVADPRSESITVRHLLSNTSGITDRTLPEKSLDQPASPAEAVTRAHRATLATAPGTAYRYTNTNFHLAARVVERVSGEPYAEYLRRHVFEPAGMRDTTAITTVPRDLPGDVAKGHIHAYGLSVPATEPDRFVAGADDVITTAEDMAKWLIVHNNGGRTADGVQLVSARAVSAMHAPYSPQWTYGLGWQESNGRVRHNGVWFTFTAGQLLLPSGYGVAVLTNSGLALGNEGTTAIEDGIAAVLEGGQPDSSSTRSLVESVLAALTLLSLVLGVRNLRRTVRWSARPLPTWQRVLRLAPRAVPLVVLLSLPALLGDLLAHGRDITGYQLAHYSLALVVWVLVASVMNLAVLVTRVWTLRRLRAA